MVESKKERRIIDDLVDIDFENIMDSHGKINEHDTLRDEKHLDFLKNYSNKARKHLRKKKTTKSKTKRKKKDCGCPK